MRIASDKITMLLVTLAVLALSGLAYAAEPKTDMVVTASTGLSGSVPWVNALYIAGQGSTFELANWYYPRRYMSYGYVPYYYSYRYPYFRHHFRHFGHFRHARFHRFYFY